MTRGREHRWSDEAPVIRRLDPATPLRDPVEAREAQTQRIARVGRVAMIALSLIFAVTLARVVQLQVAPGERLEQHITDRMSGRSEFAARGDLLDRRGRLLATTRIGRRLFVDPTLLPQPYDETIVRLSRAAGLEVDQVGERIMRALDANIERRSDGQSPIRYTPLSSVLSDAAVDNVRDLDMPGVHLEKRPVRESVAGASVAAMVGKVGFENAGLLGAEYALNARLTEEDGRLAYVHDARGRPLWIEAGAYQSPAHGDPIRLSVDLTLQQMVRAELERGLEEADAAAGRAIVVDPWTGEILSMVDLYRRIDGLAELTEENLGEKGELLEEVRYRAVRPDPGRDVHPALGRNRCVEDVYEPGSTFKPFIWSTATELELCDPEETFDTEDGRWTTPFGRYLEDVVKRDEMTWTEVLVNSSNIGMAKAGLRMSPRQMREAVLRFGFGDKTGVALPGEATGLVTSLKDWSDYTRTSVPMGYEVAVTPVQIVRAFSAFARSGDLAGSLPSIRITAPTKDDASSEMVYRVLPAWVARLARLTMRGVAENLDVLMKRRGQMDFTPRYDLFGKSGTAKIARPDGKGYFEQYCSSFIAGAPVDSPRLVVLVVIDDPGPEQIASRHHYGSAVAGPVVRRIVEKALPYLGVGGTSDE